MIKMITTTCVTGVLGLAVAFSHLLTTPSACAPQTCSLQGCECGCCDEGGSSCCGHSAEKKAPASQGCHCVHHEPTVPLPPTQKTSDPLRITLDLSTAPVAEIAVPVLASIRGAEQEAPLSFHSESPSFSILFCSWLS